MLQIKWKVSGIAIPEVQAEGVDLFHTRAAAVKRVKLCLKALHAFSKDMGVAYEIVEYSPIMRRLENLESTIRMCARDLQGIRADLRERLK